MNISVNSLPAHTHNLVVSSTGSGTVTYNNLNGQLVYGGSGAAIGPIHNGGITSPFPAFDRISKAAFENNISYYLKDFTYLYLRSEIDFNILKLLVGADINYFIIKFND